MKGSIRFDNDINIEVDVDKSAEEGAKLTSAVNLVDGQEIGGAGGNYVETFTGTANMLAPTTALPELSDANDFDDLLASGDIDIEISFDLSALDGPVIIGTVATTKLSDGTILSPKVQYITINGTSTADGSMVSHILFFSTIGLSAINAYTYQSGSWVDMTAYLHLIPTVTKIYHHPMPEE